jgi:hypothetical protein
MSAINLSQLSVEDKKKLKSDNKKNITILVLIIIQVLLCCTLAKTCVVPTADGSRRELNNRFGEQKNEKNKLL